MNKSSKRKSKSNLGRFRFFSSPLFIGHGLLFEAIMEMFAATKNPGLPTLLS